MSALILYQLLLTNIVVTIVYSFPSQQETDADPNNRQNQVAEDLTITYRDLVASEYMPLQQISNHTSYQWQSVATFAELPMEERCKTVIILSLSVKECQEMDDTTKTRYALLLYDCQLLSLGRTPIKCSLSMSNAQCTSSFDDVQLNILLTLKGSVSAHCHEAQRLLWHVLHKRTLYDLSQTDHKQLSENTMYLLDSIREQQEFLSQKQDMLRRDLMQAAKHVGQKLETSLQNQETLLQQQEKAIESQQELLQKSEQTRHSLVKMNATMIDHQDTIMRFFLDVMNILDKIREFEEGTGLAFSAIIHSFVFGTAFVAAFLITIPSPISSARATLYILLLVQSTAELIFLPQSWIWRSRKATVIIGSISVIWVWAGGKHVCLQKTKAHKDIDTQSQNLGKMNSKDIQAKYTNYDTSTQGFLDDEMDSDVSYEKGSEDEDYYSDNDYESSDVEEVRQELQNLEQDNPTGKLKGSFSYNLRLSKKSLNPITDIESPSEFFAACSIWKDVIQNTFILPQEKEWDQ
eukprot:gene5133-6996_t